MRLTIARGVVAFTSFMLSNCRPPAPATSAAPVAKTPAAAPSAPLQTPFLPPAADPNRKAKLVALVPKLDAFFAERVRETETTAGAVALVLEGEVVYVRGFGVRDLESKQRVDADTLFRIGSVSKTITALAVMRLRDQGKLVLDAPAATHLPALASLPRPTHDAPPITVRHLLTMTSGLPFDDMWGAVTFGQSDTELAELLARGPTFAGVPGVKYRYSNLGFALLGKIVEAAAGERFADFVASEVFAPLGMSSSGFVTGAIPRERMATGYFKDGDRFVAEPIDSDGVFAPAGGAYTSVNDLARYAAYHLAAYPPRDAPETGPVRRSTLREMHAGQAWGRWGDDVPVLKRHPSGAPVLSPFSYGLGWVNNTTCLAEGVIQHFGFEPGYYTAIRLLPAQGLGLVTMSATGNLRQNRTFEDVMALLKEHDVFDRAPPPPSTSLSWARDTVVQLMTGFDSDLVAKTFDPLTQRYSFVRSFRSDVEATIRDHGQCRADGDIVPLSETHGRFRLACERGAVEFIAFLTPHAKPLIQMLEWRREMPVTEKERTMAERLVTALARNSSLPANTLAPGVDITPLEKRRARLRGTYGACSLEKALWNNGKGEASFRLLCDDGPMELKLRLDAKTALLLDFSGARPREFGALCAE